MFEATKVDYYCECSETMEKRAEDEKDVYDITLNYTARGSYPQDATKQDKCAIRKRAKQYRVQDGQLYRVICSDSMNGDALSLYIKTQRRGSRYRTDNVRRRKESLIIQLKICTLYQFPTVAGSR